MRFISLIIHLLGSLRTNTSLSQFIVFLLLFLILTIIGAVAIIKVIIPFTYIAL
jgi:hypothetical protein